MTKADKARKSRVVNNMIDTAIHYGKPTSGIPALANRLHRLEATLSRLAEDEACYPTYDAAKQERIEKLAEYLVTENIGCRCYTQRDPRGYCIRMYLVNAEGKPVSNSWDGETTCLAW